MGPKGNLVLVVHRVHRDHPVKLDPQVPMGPWAHKGPKENRVNVVQSAHSVHLGYPFGADKDQKETVVTPGLPDPREILGQKAIVESWGPLVLKGPLVDHKGIADHRDHQDHRETRDRSGMRDPADHWVNRDQSVHQVHADSKDPWEKTDCVDPRVNKDLSVGLR